MIYLMDTLVILNNNSLLFKNNVEYVQEKFMQNSKMNKRPMAIFFNHLKLHLYRNI